MLDDFREQPRETLAGIIERRRKVEPEFQPPWLVGALSWLFLHPGRRAVMGKLVVNFLRLKQ